MVKREIQHYFGLPDARFAVIYNGVDTAAFHPSLREHRAAMLRNMCVSLLQHEAIKTTVPKAKELRRVAEPLITLAKIDSVANRRLAFDRTRSKAMVGKLFNDLGKRYATRQGGYLRILKCGFRAGDNAPMAYVELVDRPVGGEAVSAE